MTSEQASRFLMSVRQHYPDYYLDLCTLAMTGLRVGELYGLQWPDIDFGARALNVERQFHFDGRIAPPKTPRSRRSVDLGPETLEMFRAARAARIEEDLRTGRGETIWVMRPWVKPTPADSVNVRRMLSYTMRRSLRKAGLPEHFTPHSLRHTFAALHLARGESPKYVQEQLGHESIQITVDVYGRWMPTRNPAAAQALESAVLRHLA
jgi:integrase